MNTQEPKQETIEEVALKEYPVYMHYGESTVLHDGNEEQREAFIDGWNKCLKHQSEKMFSEEEFKQFANSIIKEIEIRKQNIIDNKESMTVHLLEGGCMAFESSQDVVKDTFNQFEKQ